MQRKTGQVNTGWVEHDKGDQLLSGCEGLLLGQEGGQVGGGCGDNTGEIHQSK